MLTVVLAPAASVQTAIDATSWGKVTSPVLRMDQGGAFTGADLFAGPSQFAPFDPDYFHGVLPNGRIVKPAGASVQVGMNPLGAVLTPDGKYLITTNDDERDTGLASVQTSGNVGGYSLSVVNTATMKPASQINNAGRLFIGLQATGTGPYTLWVSGGGDNDIKVFDISAKGAISRSSSPSIRIEPITPKDKGYVSRYTPGVPSSQPVPSGFDRRNGASTTFPAGMALSPKGDYLYVTCNGDNSLAIVDTAARRVVARVPTGYFPYAVSLDTDGKTAYVSNWGITEYKFSGPTYDENGTLVGLDPASMQNAYYVPQTSTTGNNPMTSSVTIISVPQGNAAGASVLRSVYLGKKLDELVRIGDTHPSAMAIVTRGTKRALYVARTNDDSLVILSIDGSAAPKNPITVDLSMKVGNLAGLKGTYPNAIAVSRDGSRAYIAEAGINSVAVLDTTDPFAPRLMGRIPTGWHPVSLALSSDGKSLYVVNAKGIGEDMHPMTKEAVNSPKDSSVDANYIFGTVQKVPLADWPGKNDAAAPLNYATQRDADTSVVPAGGAPSRLIDHVIFILYENKTFDSILGNDGTFGPYASTSFTDIGGARFSDPQFTGVTVNTQLLAQVFATAVNYYSDSEESDAGHQFAASGTATDYTEKTLLVKGGRGLLVNKNFEPEDYPANGYIFNNAARNGVSFKDYGAMIRIEGTDTGTSVPTRLNDPDSGNVGYPANATPDGPNNAGDVESPTHGLGQSYFVSMPILAVLGGKNANGEARLDENYPGYNFNISDQRRALEFIKDFDRMAAAGTVPRFLYIYQPNDHTGGAQATNQAQPTAAQQVADGDVALGMVVERIMRSSVYYDEKTGKGSAIFITYDDAQSTKDHIHTHRTPLILVSPFAKPQYIGTRHYSTASIVKTEELLLGLPPNNLGDLLATDLRDLFTATPNGITADNFTFTRAVAYKPSPEGQRIWSLVSRLDTSAPDRDSRRLGALARLSMQADRLASEASTKNALRSQAYVKEQQELYARAVQLAQDIANNRSHSTGASAVMPRSFPRGLLYGRRPFG